MKLPQRVAVMVVLAATLMAMPFLFFYRQPSINQILGDISTPIAANNSDCHTKSTPLLAPVPEQEIAPDKANLNFSESSTSDEGLEVVLARVATADKTVIITTLNQAWAAKGAMIDIFLESFHKGENTEFLLNHLVIVALDQKSFERCQELHQHCFMLETEGVDFSGSKGYMTEDFLKMMWRRMVLLRTILEMGYSFVFTDADILWFRNPFDYFANTDFQISSDKYRGNPGSFNNFPNCGYQYVQSNNRTIAMYRHWCKGGEDHPDVDEQTLFGLMLRRREFATYNVKIQFLETDRFSGFCERSENMTKVVTMHANCCTGMDNKIKDLRQAWKDWEFSRSLASMNTSAAALWHVPDACKHSIWPGSRHTKTSPPPRNTTISPSPGGNRGHVALLWSTMGTIHASSLGMPFVCGMYKTSSRWKWPTAS